MISSSTRNSNKYVLVCFWYVHYALQNTYTFYEDTYIFNDVVTNSILFRSFPQSNF